MYEKILTPTELIEATLKIRFSLALSKDRGGVAYPDIEKYHIACLLSQTREWFVKDRRKPWVTIEKVTSLPFELDNLLFLPESDVPSRRKLNGATYASLKAWHKLVNASGERWLLAPTLSLQTIARLILNLQIDQWISGGLTYLGQLYADKELVSFSQLQNQYNLPKGDFCKFLQLRHWLSRGRTSLLSESSFPKIYWLNFSLLGKKEKSPSGITMLAHQ